MANTKATDKIKLQNGDILTLGEAVSQNRVKFYIGGDNGGLYPHDAIPNKVNAVRYLVREGDFTWLVSKLFYLSRTGKIISF